MGRGPFSSSSSAASVESSSFSDTILPLIERVWNHLVLLLFAAMITAHFLSFDDECILSTIHGMLIDGASMAATVPQERVQISVGVAYNVPPGLLLTLGSVLFLLGVSMLIFGMRMQRTITALVVVGGGVVVMEEVTARMWLNTPAEDRYSLDLTFMRGIDTVNTFVIDLACTGSVYAIFLTISAGLHLVAMTFFKRAAQFFEGAVAAVLFVRLIANFYPTLLESHPIDVGLDVGSFFLGYPLVPFWAIAVPLAFVLGALDASPWMQVGVTTFLGAFAATKGLRTIRDYFSGVPLSLLHPHL